MPTRPLTKADFEARDRLRFAMRTAIRFGEEIARSGGLTLQQYQAMLAIRGYAGRDFVTVGELADRLQIRPHTTVELVNRLEEAGYVRRQNTDHDRRLVCIYLTDHGCEILDKVCADSTEALLAMVREVHRELGTFVSS